MPLRTNFSVLVWLFLLLFLCGDPSKLSAQRSAMRTICTSAEITTALLSPNGDSIVFNDSYGIESVSRKRRHRGKLYPWHAELLAWSPNGKLLAMVRSVGGDKRPSGTSAREEFCVLDAPRATVLRSLDKDMLGALISWLPDNQHLLFQQFISGQPGAVIKWDTNSGKVTKAVKMRVPAPLPSYSGLVPCVRSPDGRQIAYAKWKNAYSCQICIESGTRSAGVTVLDAGRLTDRLFWSADNTRLAWVGSPIPARTSRKPDVVPGAQPSPSRPVAPGEYGGPYCLYVAAVAKPRPRCVLVAQGPIGIAGWDAKGNLVCYSQGAIFEVKP